MPASVDPAASLTAGQAAQELESSPSQHEVFIRADAPAVDWNSLRDLYRYREVVWAFTKRHVKVKYKQMALGVGWAVVQPLFATLIVTLVIGRFVHVGSEGVPYAAFAMSGMVIWTFFSGALMFCMDSVLRDGGLLRKMYFPREALPLSSILAFAVDFGPAIVVFILLLLVEGIRPSAWLLLIPLPVLLVMLAALALGMATSALTVFFRDIRLLMPFVIQLGVLVTPIVYSASLIPAQWRGLYLVLNPVAEAIDTLRRIGVHETAPRWGDYSAALVFAIVLLGAAYYLFKKLEPGLVDLL
ncbi:MAG TPA: ABC transporter permease [Candidatus Dormibacteraeota bacterium]